MSESTLTVAQQEMAHPHYVSASTFPNVLRTPQMDIENGEWHTTCGECGEESEWLSSMNGMFTVKFAMARHLWDAHRISQPALLPK